MLIRTATPDDAEAIARIQVQTWRAAYAGILADSFLQRFSVERRHRAWERILQERAEITLVVSIDGRLVGFAHAGQARDPDKDPTYSGEIHELYLLPDYWGQGIGQELLEAVLDALAERQYREVMLWVLQENKRAKRFYQLNGFRWDGQVKAEAVGDRTPQQLRLSTRIRGM